MDFQWHLQMGFHICDFGCVFCLPWRAAAAESIRLALGEFGATITFAGSLGGRTRTLPVETFLALEQDPETAIAVSVLLLGISLAVLAVLRGRWLGR